MRTSILLTVAVIAGLGASLATAEGDAPSAPAPAADAAAAPAAAPADTPAAAAPSEPLDISTKATKHETVVTGTVPSLVGRWMVLSDLDLGGRPRTVPAFWEITEQDGHPVIVERFVTLPTELNALLDRKNAGSEKWEPTDAELATILAAWDDLPDQMRGVGSVRNELWGKAEFTNEIKNEPATKDADWVVRQTYLFMPGGNRPVRQVNVFGTLDEIPRGFAGNTAGVALAMAPFPVPIPFGGTFRMIRLDGTPERGGILARIADMFKGCGS